MKRLTAILSATLLLATGALAQAPGEVELEMWRSAARIDTPAAYQAYLAAYPGGSFAPMARAALAKAPAAAVVGASTVGVPTATAPPASALAPLAGSATSGSTELATGTKLVGPGVITVGSIGAKRQLVIPAGEWVLLAAEDHRTSGSLQHSLASLAFGQFAGAELRSLLVASFNRRAISVSSGGSGTYQAMGLLPRWTTAEQCEAATAADLLREVGGTPTLRHCAAVRPADDWRATLAQTPLPEALDRVLKAVQASVPPFALRSELHFTDQRYGWLGLTRFDTAAVGAAPSRADWLRRYLPLATRGYGRNIDAADLLPGQAAPANDIVLAF
jgi:hypothetical protein